jgi:hypothetical protein
MATTRVRGSVSGVADWTRNLSGLTSYQAAQVIIKGLRGYRQTSLHRANDTDDLTNALKAFADLCNGGIVHDT